MKKTFVIALIMYCLFPVTFAYTNNMIEEEEDVRLRKDKPTVYITFERTGERRPLEEGESNKGVWLRLHNNTRWKIKIAAFNVPESPSSPKDGKEVGLYYEVEMVNHSGEGQFVRGAKESSKTKENSDLPIGYRKGGVISHTWIQPGDSLIFSIPREHLTKDLKIYVGFQYEWEKRKGYVGIDGEPEHHVYFSSNDLPKMSSKSECRQR